MNPLHTAINDVLNMTDFQGDRDTLITEIEMKIMLSAITQLLQTKSESMQQTITSKLEQATLEQKMAVVTQYFSEHEIQQAVTHASQSLFTNIVSQFYEK
jgi:hypothetical protein